MPNVILTQRPLGAVDREFVYILNSLRDTRRPLMWNFFAGGFLEHFEVILMYLLFQRAIAKDAASIRRTHPGTAEKLLRQF